jgi:putative PIN family toxin of toxin-antitoxin system
MTKFSGGVAEKRYFSEFTAPLRSDMANRSDLRAVLDSNVLLSLLVFADPRYPGVAEAWRIGTLCVLADAECAGEFRRVLGYPRLKLSPERQAAVFAEFESRAQGAVAPAGGAGNESLPVCADADDQKFLELAAACAADCLVTGDKQLLKLAKRVPFAIITADALEARIKDWK